MAEQGFGCLSAPDQLEAVVCRSGTQVEEREGAMFLLPALIVQIVGLRQNSYSRKRRTRLQDVQDRDITLRSRRHGSDGRDLGAVSIKHLPSSSVLSDTWSFVSEEFEVFKEPVLEAVLLEASVSGPGVNHWFWSRFKA
jgi:hypothetical protein